MVAIQLKGTVQQDGTLELKLPAGVAPGEHELVVVLPLDAPAEERAGENGVPARTRKLELTAYPVGLVDDSFTFRREDLYGDQP